MHRHVLYAHSKKQQEHSGGMKLVEISEDLKEIVSSTLSSISEGLKDKNCQLLGEIEFELAIIKKGDMKGGLKFIIADASGKYSKESVSRVKFKVVGNTKLHRDMLWIPAQETSAQKIKHIIQE